MQFSTLAAIVVLASSAFAWDKSSGTGITTPPTGTCYTITQTNSPACTASVKLPDVCITEACLQLSTITQSCGCDKIYTEDACFSTCPPVKCGISYITIHPPCPTSPPYSFSNTTVTTTVTDITTLTTCPATCTCSGQKTTWTGGNGPFSCTKKPSCTAQLPGGGTTTITVSDDYEEKGME